MITGFGLVSSVDRGWYTWCSGGRAVMGRPTGHGRGVLENHAVLREEGRADE